MFNLFGNKVSKLTKSYEKIMHDAMLAQRNGNIALYAELSAKADKLLKEIELLKNEKK